MGFFEQFPYVNQQNLNVDWALQVLQHAHKTLSHLNDTIEGVVRPMIDAQNVFYQRLIDKATTDMRVQTANFGNQLKQTTAMLNKTVYESNQKLDRAVTDMKRANEQLSANVGTALSKSLNEMNTTLAYYRAVFDAQSVQSNKALQELIRKHDAEMRILFQGQEAQLSSLKQYVDSTIDETLTDVNNMSLKLRADMAALARKASEDNSINLNMIVGIGENLAKLVKEHQGDIQVYYLWTKSLFSGISALLNNKIDNKADTSYVDAQIKAVKDLFVVLDGNVMLISPVDNQLRGLQDILYEIYNAKKPLSLTAGEYDALKITAGEYDAMHLTAYQYDNYARWYLILYKEVWDYVHAYTDSRVDPLEQRIDAMEAHYDTIISNFRAEMEECCKQVNNDIRMFNPWTGEYDLVKKVVEKLVESIARNALTAGEYDALHLTAEEYDSKHLTAGQYDFNGKLLLGGK